jgi:hypothetical protein
MSVRVTKKRYARAVNNFLREMVETTNCICTGAIGRIVKDWQLKLDCVHCRAKRLLQLGKRVHP